MLSKASTIAPAVATGAAVLAGCVYLWRRKPARNQESNVFDTLEGIMTPDATGALDQGGGACCGGGASACCKGESQEESCGCSVASERSGSIRVGRAPDGRVGLPKDEYKRLKKAGLLPKQLAKKEVQQKQQAVLQAARLAGKREMVVLYASQGGKSESIAFDMREDACEKGFNATARNLSTFEMTTFLARTNPLPLVVFVVSSWTGGTPPPSSRPFFEWINSEERPSNLLSGLKFSVFALGDSAYGKEDFCKAARALDTRLETLGAVRQTAIAEEDESDRKEVFGKWKDQVWMSQGAKILGNSVQFPSTAGEESSSAEESGEEDDDFDEADEDEEEEEEGEEGGVEESRKAKGDGLTDMEDLGAVMSAGMQKKKKAAAGEVAISSGPKPMLNDSLAESLTKQGYKLVGTHSGVKLCRWTKAMLRGRGGCYKHTFYGIASYQCMEATPSLACANKCVFCWRHHKNPVGTSWRWQVDDPELLIKGFTENHRSMIREMRGLPGVIPERLEEAKTIKHCALSLVGEPIIYPHINTFLNRLHEEGISSFLVSNAQFPAAMESLVPCTQLYVSIDASNAAELKEIDRPLFKDFWQRFLDCIDILANKGQRTVFRLTLVKAFNMAEVEGYAELIRRGKPDFVEVKGVTFTGGKKPQLGMSNVPWHAEVVEFTSAICKLVADDYEVASEHAHSCAVLLAHKKFKKGNDWYTWIDFPKFLQLSKQSAPFSSADYMAKTPEWAVFGRGLPGDGGFDPAEVHWRKGDSRTTTPASTRPSTPAPSF